MRLGELQSRMARALFRPLDKTWSMDRRLGETPSAQAEAELYIRANQRLSAFERLEIYNQSYWYRVLDVLSEDFPGLCAILGRKGFTALSFAYLTACPSRSFTLRNLGSRLPRWLSTHPEFITEAPRLALDMARLEWADVEAFDGEECAPMEIGLALSQGGEARVGLQPHLTLLECAYAVDELRLEIDELGESRFAQGRARARRMSRTAPEPHFIAVHRHELCVHYRRLAAPEYHLLRALGRGMSLTAALDATLRRSGELRTEWVQEWFAIWARLGWLCAPR